MKRHLLGALALTAFLATACSAGTAGDDETQTGDGASAAAGGSTPQGGGTATGTGQPGGSAPQGGSGPQGGTGHTAGAGGQAASGAGGAAGAGGVTAESCWGHKGGTMEGPDYDQFGPVVGTHCMGTNHQDITGLEKVVFLGDSVTEGTPPTLAWQYYRNVLVSHLQAQFGPLEVENCAAWGARTDDLLIGQEQIHECFPGPEPKRTLVVMTVGGNDIAAWAEAKLSVDEGIAEADAAVQLLRDGVEWFYADPARFPAGVYVVFSNVYEYTDGTGDLLSCPAAILAGMSGSWIEGAPAVIHFQEQFMRVAIDTGSDMIFMLENFCGHGFRRDDPSAPCYLGPGTEHWFDFTCTHPNPRGHAEIADMFAATIFE